MTRSSVPPDAPPEGTTAGRKKRKLFKRIMARLLLLFFSIFIGLLLAEGYLRLTSPLPEMPDNLYNQYDELLGWAKQPNRRNRILAAEYDVTQIVNNEGFIGPDYPIKKADNEYRILILGDSFTEGYNVEFEDIFSEVLRRELQEKHPERKIQVINTGVGGYSTDQQLLVFQHKGKKYKPDLTILMFYHNDVWPNSQPYAYGGLLKPYFELKGEQLHLQNVPVPPVFLFNQPDGHDLSSLQLGLYKTKAWLRNNSLLYVRLRSAVKTIPAIENMAVRVGLAHKAKSDATLSLDARPGQPVVPDLFRVWEKDYKPEVVHAWDVTEALLAVLQEETAAIGGEFLVFYIPVRAEIYPDDWEAMCRKYGIDSEHWDVEKCGRDLGTVCRRLDIPYINSTKSFQDKAPELLTEDIRLYGKLDGHWNEQGHLLAGELLGQETQQMIQNSPRISQNR